MASERDYGSLFRGYLKDTDNRKSQAPTLPYYQELSLDDKLYLLTEDLFVKTLKERVAAGEIKTASQLRDAVGKNRFYQYYDLREEAYIDQNEEREAEEQTEEIEEKIRENRPASQLLTYCCARYDSDPECPQTTMVACLAMAMNQDYWAARNDTEGSSGRVTMAAAARLLNSKVRRYYPARELWTLLGNGKNQILVSDCGKWIVKDANDNIYDPMQEQVATLADYRYGDCYRVKAAIAFDF